MIALQIPSTALSILSLATLKDAKSTGTSKLAILTLSVQVIRLVTANLSVFSCSSKLVTSSLTSCFCSILATEIKVEDLLTKVEYDYPHFHLIMHCYLCSIKSGQLSLLEHEDARWLTTNELNTVLWLPADKIIVEQLIVANVK